VCSSLDRATREGIEIAKAGGVLARGRVSKKVPCTLAKTVFVPKTATDYFALEKLRDGPLDLHKYLNPRNTSARAIRFADMESIINKSDQIER
jgi:hypothetical protein